MRVWSRTLSGRLCRVTSSFSENMAEKDNNEVMHDRMPQDLTHNQYTMYDKI